MWPHIYVIVFLKDSIESFPPPPRPPRPGSAAPSIPPPRIPPRNPERSVCRTAIQITEVKAEPCSTEHYATSGIGKNNAK